MGAADVSAAASRPEGFVAAVCAVVAATRPGEVLAYGEVAMEAGSPGAARAVGRVLARHGRDLPWWRVVSSRGRLAPGLETEQARRLASEGVACRDGRVVVATIAHTERDER